MYRDKCKIMYTDTDSFIYHIECDDVYKNIKRDRFDTSDYPADNVYASRKQKKYKFKERYWISRYPMFVLWMILLQQKVSM